MPITFSGLEGIEEEILAQLPTRGDLAAALYGQNQRILLKTSQGYGYDGESFEEYASEYPYYYYPEGGVKHLAATHLRITSQIRGLKVTRTTKGLKFENYGEFKRAFGHANVDLFGVSPLAHMLGAVQMNINGGEVFLSGYSGHLTGLALSGTLGIYGDLGRRAELHNEGLGRMPRREFFGLSESDIEDIVADIERGIYTRVRNL